jgi:hypothetical protein
MAGVRARAVLARPELLGVDALHGFGSLLRGRRWRARGRLCLTQRRSVDVDELNRVRNLGLVPTGRAQGLAGRMNGRGDAVAEEEVRRGVAGEDYVGMKSATPGRRRGRPSRRRQDRARATRRVYALGVGCVRG